MKSPYICSECELGAMVLNGELVRFCECNAPVVTNMESTVIGKSSVGA